MSEVNAPAVVAEVSTLHDAYERALAANDVPALNAFFWASPHTVRYGVNEHLYGADAVAAYRQGHAPAFTERTVLRRAVVTFGDDMASVMCELRQKIFEQVRHSRQSQVWRRFPGVGWKIVAAHVSHALSVPDGMVAWEHYVDQSATTLGLPLHRDHRPGVVQSLQRTAAIAAPLLAFKLPGDAELASVFTP